MNERDARQSAFSLPEAEKERRLQELRKRFAASTGQGAKKTPRPGILLTKISIALLMALVVVTGILAAVF
ncbi:MAG: hypothetical protein FWF20_07300 [Betaproteobacteria bacterium]|nr:hypothetical protein [Betaproteobacteria bacterium]MCL2886575.1 hypothetical protein [Betaproteobacteria bacterium]